MQSLAARRAARRHLYDAITEREERRGLLIALEGPDGAGKSTQRKLLKKWLQSEGADVVTSTWNSSPLLKPSIKTRKSIHVLSPEEFCLLHAADFRHRLETEILPALWAGRTVLADRYLFTGLARDAARGLELDWLLRVYSPIIWPDLVVYFSVSPATSGERIAAERAPKYYEAGQDVTALTDPHASYLRFITRVINEYESLALVFRFVTIDAEGSIYDQHRELRRIVSDTPRRPWSQWNRGPVADWLGRSAG